MMEPCGTIAGVQASSLRPYLQTESDLRASLSRLAEMGCRVVQMQWWNPAFPPELVAAAVRDAGLRCVSTQDFYTAVRDDFARTVRLNELCGGTCVCVSGIPAETLSRNSVLAFAQELTAMAARLTPLGMTLAFHPRAREWARTDAAPDAPRCTELLLEHTPEAVTLGLDFYHSGKAGLAADALLRRWAGRVEFVHFKDYILRADGSEALVPVGQGVTDWRAAVRACRETGVRWAFVEQETWDKDAFVCLREGLDAMRDWGFAL